MLPAKKKKKAATVELHSTRAQSSREFDSVVGGMGWGGVEWNCPIVYISNVL